jgi:hypothetical protein
MAVMPSSIVVHRLFIEIVVLFKTQLQSIGNAIYTTSYATGRDAQQQPVSVLQWSQLMAL